MVIQDFVNWKTEGQEGLDLFITESSPRECLKPEAVLRFRDVYSGSRSDIFPSRIRIFSRISYPHERI